MGQGHSSTKSSGQHLSKYGPQNDTAASTKHKKKGRSSSSKSISSSSQSASRSTAGPSHGSSLEAGGGELGSRTAPGERGLPAVPPRPARASSLTSRSPQTGGHQHRSHHERKSNAPPTLPSRQFSLSKQTSTASMGSSGGILKHNLIEKYFNLYKDKEEDLILAEGMERFCIDLNVDPTEFIVLVLAWKFGASQMCRFTREEFMNGCQKMEAYDAKSLRNRFPRLLQDAQEDFKDLYQFTFSFGLDHGTGQRSLPTDMAVQLWELVFTQEKPAVLDRWFAFLSNSDIRGISRDTWNMFLDFCQNVAPDLSNYDESEAWPSLFDDFVECEQANGGTS